MDDEVERSQEEAETERADGEQKLEALETLMRSFEEEEVQS